MKTGLIAPTVAEVALPGFNYDAWYAIFTAARTPRPVINQVNREVARIMGLPVKERMAQQGAVVKPGTLEALTATLKEDIAMLKKVAAAANVRID